MFELITLPKLYQDQKVPKLWGTNDLAPRKCPFCNTVGEEKYKRPDDLIVCYCNECSSYFISPAPTQAKIDEFYAHYTEGLGSDLRVSLARYVLASVPDYDFRLTELSSIMDIRGKNVLDVGFGAGEAMICFKKMGATVEGVNPDDAAISFAKNQLGLENVFRSTIEDFEPNHKYDVVWMSAVVEHPSDPLLMLKKAKQLLKPRGVLAITTPNVSFASHQLQPEIFRDSFDHMQYLSFATCAYIANRISLRLIHLEGYGIFPVNRGQMNRTDRVLTSLRENHYLYPLHNYALALVWKLPILGKHGWVIREQNRCAGQGLLFCILQKNLQ